MRFFDLSATVLAAAVAMSGAVADAPAGYGDSSMTSATTTYYTTRTVLRVETTVTATRNGSATTYESLVSSTVAASHSGIIPYGNGTSSIYGTGAMPTSTYTPPASTGAASKLQALGFAAIAGFAGLLVV